MWKFVLIVGITAGMFLSVTYAGSNEAISDESSESSEDDSAEDNDNYEDGNNDTECSCKKNCPEGEEYSDCPQAICGPITCDETGFPKTICGDKAICEPGCLCKDGKLRNKDGECVSPDQCPSCGGDKNAMLGCGTNCKKKCSDLVNPNRVCGIGCQLNGCNCKNGFYYDSNLKKCVKPEECTSTCPKGEVYSACPAAICGPLTCAEAGYPKKSCGNSSPCSSNASCICQDSYLRNSTGKCIPSNQCPSCGGDENAIPSNRGNCGRTCADVGKNVTACPEVYIINGCECKPNYYYDTKIKKCVTAEKCIPSCPAGEEYLDCPEASCKPLTCDEVGYPKSNCGNSSLHSCKPRCVCKYGNVKNKAGKCVSRKECPSCGGDINAEPGCATNCGKKCSDVVIPKLMCPKICFNNGCDCKKGYYYNGVSKKCVKAEDCPSSSVCPKPNEVYASCPSPGPGQLCTDYLKNSTCPSDNSGNNTTVCHPACICKKDTYRNKKGNCVSGSQCKDDACPDGEEYSECPDASCSPLTCDKAGFPNPNCGNSSSCPGKPGCICKDGKLRNKDGKCVDSNECPSCGGDENAVLGCGNHCGRTCADLRSNVTRICPLYCILNACSCRPNYYYDGNTKKCVKPEQCSSTCPVGEVYKECPPVECDADYCPRSSDSPLKCPIPKKCAKGRCVCGPNKKRDRKTGKCIPVAKCPPFLCSKPNEVYDKCPQESQCPRETCDDYLENSPCAKHRLGISVPCKPACKCKKGYYKDSKGNCVTPQKCEELACKPNEVFSNCSNAICRAQDCKDKGKPVPCPDLKPGACIRSCVCRENYLKKNGVCVPQDQCVDTPTCPVGEVYKECPPVKCDADYCPQSRDSPQKCPIPKNCEKGRCVCGPNKKRDRKTGKCIPVAKCPPFPCSKPNEVYDKCPQESQCPRETCDDYLENSPCAKHRLGISVPCKPACKCKKGYYKDSKGNCVTPQKCEELACKPNEVFSSCSNAICRAQDCKDKGKPVPCPKLKPGACIPGCVCRENYLKKNGECVPEDQCVDNEKECGCGQKPQQPSNNTCGNVENLKLALTHGSNMFTINFLYQQVKANPGKSVISSPTSALPCLAILALKADGPTFTEIAKVMNLTTKEQIRCVFKSFLDSFQTAEGTQLDLANKIYVSENYKLNSSFEQDTKNIINAEVESANFSEPVKAAANANKWVSDQTKGKIKDLISPSMLDSLTRLILLSACYFKGTWKTKFNPNNTKSTDFYVNPSKTIKVDMMQLKTKMKYSNNKDLDAQLIELPYMDLNVTLLVVVPNQKFSSSDLLVKMQDPTILNTAMNNLYEETVTLYLPKIDVSSSTDLKEILKSIGVKTIFDDSAAELRGLIVPDEDLYVSKAVQKATITINEEGSVAAAANAFIVSTRTASVRPQMQYVVKADHPYLYCIKIRKILLFCGVFTG
ncbi:unnamed protein product [Chilo suppressalis]|uniref:Serpin domain-containing protein n=1 Tax=Chilo suppressalis TaxID=168631 RepID=A0ABN8BCB1_CHISP|nr:unnamed protein product [Chilo suppressalis]